MDRRQRKTREAIFHAFTELLFKKHYNQITVGDIIDCADVGRATFYSHFETKDFLLKAFCKELFCHLFDAQNGTGHDHKHIFDCDSSESVILHLFRHLQKNDNNILTLLSCQNNALFLSYFKSNLENLIENNLSLFESQKRDLVPAPFWKNHIVSTFMGTIEWWIGNAMQESPETITEYFFAVI